MKQLCQVIMLPTAKDEVRLLTIKYMDQDSSGVSFIANSPGEPRHLYFVSYETPKEGDWFIANEAARKCIRIEEGNYPYVTIQGNEEVKHFHTWKTKIIASSDQSLGLPLIPQSFIEQYVKAEGKIDEVYVETEILGYKKGNTRITSGKHTIEFDDAEDKSIEVIKTTKDNHVIISLAEQKVYSREQVEVVLKNFLQFLANKHNINQPLGGVEEWIEDNL